MSFWERISTAVLFKHQRITIVEDSVRLPDNTETQYLRYEDLHDFVSVIGRRDNKIAFIREYSYPLDRFLLQLPEGSIEEGEDVMACAGRELKEEAGLAAEQYESIGRSPADHRRSTVWQNIVVARQIQEVIKAGGDAEEQGTETVWIAEHEVDDMIARGEIIQRNALTAWAVFKAVDAQKSS